MASDRKLNGYNVVYDPSSKYCMKSDNWKGYVYEHIRNVELERGEIPDGYHVHHLDGDKLNNRIDNLILLSNSDHIRLHNWLTSCDSLLKGNDANRMNSVEPKLTYCKHCNSLLKASQSTFCSVRCQNKASSKRPDDEVLFTTYNYLGADEAAKIFGVAPQTIRRWVR